MSVYSSSIAGLDGFTMQLHGLRHGAAYGALARDPKKGASTLGFVNQQT